MNTTTPVQTAATPTKVSPAITSAPRAPKVQKIDPRALEKAEELLGGLPRLKVLEAGCGACSHVLFKAEVESFGIDVSAEELAKNQDIQHKMQGDLETYPLPRGEFDVVVCWDVIEHLSNPRAALSNMFTSLRPGGVLVLGFPNLLSFKGMVTKFTPLWFHTFFYKAIMRYKFRPFKTYLRAAIIPGRVVHYAVQNGMETAYLKLEEGKTQIKVRQRFFVLGAAFAAFQFVSRLVTFGRGPNWYEDYCMLILRRKSS